MKIRITLFVLFSTIFSYSQEEQEIEIQNDTLDTEYLAKNEVSLGIFNLIAFGALDLAYEHILNENSSVSGEVFTQAFKDKEAADSYDKAFSFTGKYKYFFSADYARGFYLQGFGMLSHGEYETGRGRIVDGVQQEDLRNYTDFALGLGAGGKFVSNQGFILDLGASLGKNLFNPNAPNIAGQFNVNIGYRF